MNFAINFVIIDMTPVMPYSGESAMNYSNSTNNLKVLALAGAISAVLFTGYPADTEAGIGGGWERASHVEDLVTDNMDGTWTYDFNVFNDSFFSGYGTFDEPFIIDWELPYFGDMGITGIDSPAGWFSSIETIGVANPSTGWGGVADWQTPGDPWKTFFDDFYGSAAANPFNGPGGQVLHWFTDDPCFLPSETLGAALAGGCITPGDSLAGFGFDAAGLPNSPSINPIPLPGAAVLFAFGLAGLAGVARRKRSRCSAA
jgi:hypothetical protein